MKGEQSDALKRSGFVWGIGRALYSAPKIRIPETNAKLSVSKIEYSEEDKITDLQIVDWKGNVVFNFANGKVKPVEEADRVDTLKVVCSELKGAGEDKSQLLKFFNYYQERCESFDSWNVKLVRKLWGKWIERADSR